MSKVLKQLKLNTLPNKNKTILGFKLIHGQRNWFISSTRRGNNDLKIALSFATGCSVTGLGCYVWWKTKHDNHLKYTSGPRPSDLSNVNENASESRDLKLELSTTPWLKSREPVLSREAILKQMLDKMNTAKRQANDLCLRIKVLFDMNDFGIILVFHRRLIIQIAIVNR